jgi:MFS family permease
LRLVVLALLGATAGQAVVWYGGQFYALFFLEKTLQVESASANLIIAAALLIGTPFFIVFGAWSDRIGRKTLVLGGCVLAALTYFPTFKAITHFANPALERAVAEAPVRVVADPADCSLQFDPVGKSAFRTSCDIAKTALARAGVPYSNEAAPAGSIAQVQIGTGGEARTVTSFAGSELPEIVFKESAGTFNTTLRGALDTAGYPARADMSQINYPMVVLLCAWLVLLVTMVYGPIAAWLVELFPTRIRYTSMSLPYHLGNGWFGGFLPVTSFAIVAATGDIYAGLWYPIVVALATALIGALFLRETHRSPLPD